MDRNQKSTLSFFIFFFIMMAVMSYFNNKDFGWKNIFAAFIGATVGSLVFYFFNRMSNKNQAK
ncbi:MAG: hypothetical protein V4648_08285 [Bacteroidota bacterium]